MASARRELNFRHAERLKNYSSQVAYWRQSIFHYCVERLGVKAETLDWSLYPEYKNHIWDGTPNPIMAIFKALQDGMWVRVKSAVGVNKTFSAACIDLWFLECHPGAYVPTTAPKESQLLSQIWSEIAKLYKNFNKGKLLTGELRMEADTNTKWKSEAFVAGTKATKDSEDKAQGMHAEHMLTIIEETPGVPPSVLKALINTSTASHNLILALGNPNSKIDNFREFDKLSRVVDIRISALDHPNIVTGKEVIPGAQSVIGLQTLKDKYGISHPLYLSRARGLTPDSAIDSLIKAEWIDDAVRRYNELCNDDGSLDIEKVIRYNNSLKVDDSEGLGVDVANSESGDLAALTYGRGFVCFHVEAFPCPNANKLGHQVHQICKDRFINQRKVGIDGVGVGAGTVNTLKEYGYLDEEINLQGGASPIVVEGSLELFLNLRSQMWWKTREDFRCGRLAIVNDEELIADLLTPKWEVKTDKKIKVQSKVEIKKLLGHSPNKGDAFIYWNWKNRNMPLAYSSAAPKEENKRNQSLTKRLGL